MIKMPKQDRLPDGKNAILTEDYSLNIYDKFNFRLTAKKGYVYDGFSVPFALQGFQNRWRGCLPAALFHDLAYGTHFLNIGDADWLFLVILEMGGYNWIQRNLLYSSVRAFGWMVYPKTQKELASDSQFLRIVKL